MCRNYSPTDPIKINFYLPYFIYIGFYSILQVSVFQFDLNIAIKSCDKLYF